MGKHFDKKWFGKIGLVMSEFGPKYVGVHVHNPGQLCRLVRMPVTDFETPEVWAKIRDLVAVTPDNDSPAVCPVCKMPKKNWGRRYLERGFCGYCGERWPIESSDVKDNV